MEAGPKNRRQVLKMGAWNTERKELGLQYVFKEIKLEKLTITETTKLEQGILKLTRKHVIIYSEVTADKRVEAGVEYVTHKKLENHIFNWNQLSEQPYREEKRIRMSEQLFKVQGK